MDFGYEFFVRCMCCECFKISLTKKSISLTNKEDNNGTYISAKADKGASC